jgi:hypothetical protein
VKSEELHTLCRSIPLANPARKRCEPFGTGFVFINSVETLSKETTMRRILMASMLGVCLAGVPALVGCDRDVAHTHTEDVKPDGTSVTKDNKVTKNADGSITHTETKDVNKAP